MRKVELFTADGHFVATVEILPIPNQALPSVVVWGARMFVDASLVEADTSVREPPRYVECFALLSLTPSPGFPRISTPESEAG